MFELNLIKDKAKARQRRRVIFLGIVTILLLSGLLAIVVGSLFWQEMTLLEKVNSDIASTDKANQAIDAENKEREPKARKRRNAMIVAYQEDLEVRQNRPYFAPILRDFAEISPKSAQFWYNSITITQPTTGGGGRGQAYDQGAKDLMATRSLIGTGYIQIEQSDVLTQTELTTLSSRMQSMVRLVGQPRFEMDMSRDQSAVQGSGRYVPFTIQASTTVFAGAGAIR
ncbi:MAG: hypothetical protein KF696_02435 [Planctomycetes bacterium]|nr:hypothetical protein [Planctomycetota bacterium]MCW8134860.1 hypothetical protein [Planctomycetota bacterium]